MTDTVELRVAENDPVPSIGYARRVRTWRDLRHTIEYARSLTPAQARGLLRGIDDAIERERGPASASRHPKLPSSRTDGATRDHD